MPRSFAAGQAFWGKIRFPDGDFPAYDRPYLIIGTDGEYIEILTVSSVEGKEWKLSIPTNREIINYYPPFPKNTFVKLDSFQKIHVKDLTGIHMAAGGKTLDEKELSEIIIAVNKIKDS